MKAKTVKTTGGAKSAKGKRLKQIANVPAAIKPQLPKGFKAVSKGFAPSWRYLDNPLLVGKILAFSEVESSYKDPGTKKYKMQKTCVIEQHDGNGPVTVWESAGVRSLFELKKGAEVAITFNGYIPIKGRKEPMKDFTVATK